MADHYKDYYYEPKEEAPSVTDSVTFRELRARIAVLGYNPSDHDNASQVAYLFKLIFGVEND